MAQLFFLSGRAWTDANGNPYPAAVAHFYVPGTTTNQDAYTTAGLSVATTNPLVSDASTGIWGDAYFSAKRYKIVIKDASGNTLKTWEVVDGTKQRVYQADAPSPTYPALEWVDTDDNTLYERNTADSGWNNRGDADAAINAASVTEVLTGTSAAKAVTPDSGAALWQRGTNITPAAGTVSLPSTGGGVYNIAAGNFSAISSAQGGRRLLFVFSGASVITHSATSMILLGAANITTEAGDVAEFTNEAASDVSGANWRMTDWSPNEGRLIAVATQAMMEAATNTEMPVTPVAVKWNPGVCKAWVKFSMAAAINASHNVSSIDDDAAANFGINFTVAFSSTHYCAVEATVATANNKISFANMATTDIDADLFRSDDTGSEINTTSAMCAFFGDQ